MSTPAKRIAFHTLGCKLNFSESSTIKRDFIKHGYETVHYKDSADFYVLNTCSVTENANRECRRIIRKAKIEIKGSTLWEGQDELFRWQQIRPAHDYDRMVFLAMYPDRIDLFIAEKDEVNNFVQQQDEDGNFVHNQHGGKTVDSGTFFIQGKPSDFAFMKPLDRYL